jgi:hypothetical protein
VVTLDPQVLELALRLAAMLGRRVGQLDLRLPPGPHQEFDEVDRMPPLVAVDQAFAIDEVNLAAIGMGSLVVRAHSHPHP